MIYSINELEHYDIEDYESNPLFTHWCYDNGDTLIDFTLARPYHHNDTTITFATDELGKLKVADYDIFQDKYGFYIEYGIRYEKVYINNFLED